MLIYPENGVAVATVAPYAGATAVCQIPRGASVVFEGNYNNAYALISYQGISGFVPIGYLSLYEDQM